jgi:hypothetical protein
MSGAELLPDAVARALDYPYAAPSGSFLFRDGRETRYEPPGREAHGRRVPVIGYGSNRAAAALARKYPGEASIPVEAAWLEGFDVVYAARIAGYGAVPATLASCPGCRVAVKIVWLSLDQLPAMHASESIGVGYDFGVLEAPIHCEHSGFLPRALVYIAIGGAFAPSGEPLALHGLEAEHRRWQTAPQRHIQEQMRAALAPETPLATFLSDHIADRALRLERAAWLAKTALPWQEKRFRPLSAEDPL